MVDVICAGFGRTGTLSLKAALEALGYSPCWHIEDMMGGGAGEGGQLSQWRRLARGGSVDWKALLADYRATTDFPACLYYREQIHAFPDAKVILTIREPRAWADSIVALRGHFEQLAKQPRMQAGAGLIWHETTQALVWDRLGDAKDIDFLVDVFEGHVEAVKRDVSADRLLVFEVRQGWQPLCNFLGAPVPETPFPRLNEREALSR